MWSFVLQISEDVEDGLSQMSDISNIESELLPIDHTV